MKIPLWSFSSVISPVISSSLWTTPKWRRCINKHSQLAADLPQSSLNQCLGAMCELISNVQPCMDWGRLKLLDLLGAAVSGGIPCKVFAFWKIPSRGHAELFWIGSGILCASWVQNWHSSVFSLSQFSLSAQLHKLGMTNRAPPTVENFSYSSCGYKSIFGHVAVTWPNFWKERKVPF